MSSNDQPGENADDKNKNEPVLDAELDNLLDDALADFDKISSQEKEMRKEKPHKPSTDTTEMPLDGNLNETIFNEIYENVLKMMGTESEGAVGGVGTSPEINGSVNETIQKALNNLNKDLGNIEGGGDMSQEMLDLLSKMNLDDDDADITPLVHDMMSSLLSKDVLYPSLKDIASKYPQWLTENESKLEKKEFNRYRQQYELVGRIVKEYEAESMKDNEKTKKERFERILDHMQNMQQLGHPPKEIIGDAAKDLPFGDGSFLPRMTDSGFDPNQCSVS